MLGENDQLIPRPPLRRYHNKAIYTRILFVSSLLFLVVSLLLFYKIFYIADDIVWSMMPGILRVNHWRLWDQIYSSFRDVTNMGRFYPLINYAFAVFYYLPTLFAYRTFLLILNIIVAGSLGMLVYKMTKQWALAIFSILLLPIFFQFRIFHDPIAGFYGMLQIVALYMIWGIFLQLKAIETKKLFPLILSSFLFLLSLLTYEVSFTFMAPFILIALAVPKEKRRIKYVFPHIIVMLIIAVCNVFTRATAVNPSYDGVKASWNLSSIVSAWFYQVSASFPLSYWMRTTGYDWLTNPKPLAHQLKNYLKLIKIDDIVLAFVLGFLVFQVILQIKKIKIPLVFLLVGLSILILPAGLISLSAKYQKELSFGLGYLPVYLQYLGLVVVFIYLLNFVFIYVKRNFVLKSLAILLSLVFSLSFIANNVSNRSVVAHYAKSTGPQAISAQALELGILDLVNVEKDALFLTSGGGYGLDAAPLKFIYTYTDNITMSGTTVEALATSPHSRIEITADKQSATAYPAVSYTMRSVGEPMSGLVVAGKINSVRYDPASFLANQVTTTEAIIFLWNNGKNILEFNTTGSTPQHIAIKISDILSSPMSEELDISSSTQLASANLQITRLGKVNQKTGADAFFSVDQAKYCIIKIKANEGGLDVFTFNVGVKK